MSEVDKTVVIEADHYRETRVRLQQDPIIIQMAEEIPANWRELGLTHEDGQPTYEFMMGCLDEYHRRGGEDGGHMGGCSQAVVQLLRDRDASVPS